jgi:hypothetical protein
VMVGGIMIRSGRDGLCNGEEVGMVRGYREGEPQRAIFGVRCLPSMFLPRRLESRVWCCGSLGRPGRGGSSVSANGWRGVSDQ